MTTTASTDIAPGLRARKKRATRHALQEAAVRLFSRQGPESVTVDDICAAADVSPRTFFNYFSTKEEVLAPWDRSVVAEAADQIAFRPESEEPLDAVQAVLAGMLDNAMRNTTWHARATLLGEHPALLHRAILNTHSLETAVREGIARRTGAECEDFHVRLVAATALAALRVTMETCRESSDSPSTATLNVAFSRLRAGLPGS